MRAFPTHIVPLAVFAIVVFSFVSSARAQEVQLLEPDVPLYEGVTAGESGSLANYLNNLFKLGIGVATALAVIYIAIGGANMMLTAGNITKREEGEEMIRSAIWGLVLALAGVLILQTINPDILKFNFIKRLEDLGKIVAEQAPQPPETGGGGGPLPGPQDPQGDARVRQELEDAGIDANQSCAGGQRPCANLDGLPQNAITGLKELKSGCGCEVFVTGGTEGEHAAHGSGNPIVDLRVTDSLLTYVRANASRTYSDGVGFVYEVGNDNYRYEADQTQQHFHVCYDQKCR